VRNITWILLVLVIACFAANNEGISTPRINAHPQPAVYNEFYWDDGMVDSAWVWYTGGNYWAVQFDDDKTGGCEGNVNSVGCCSYSGWPDSTFQGTYLHIFDDYGSYPNTDLSRDFVATGSTFVFVDTNVDISTSVFYVAWEQYGNYPACDGMAVDAAAGTHNWTGFSGSWGPDSAYGDFMLRCYWQEKPGVATSSWGAVKSLYQ